MHKATNHGPERADVLRLIHDYEAEDANQDRLKGEFLTFLEQSSNACHRGQYDPGHITASAVVLDETLRNILLVYHCTLKRWLQPGGHVEAQDRTLAQAAVRELWEETGIIAPANHATLFDLDIHPFAAKNSEPNHLHFDVRFLVVTPEKRTTTESAEAAVKWFPLIEKHQAGDLDRLLDKCLHYRTRLAF